MDVLRVENKPTISHKWSDALIWSSWIRSLNLLASFGIQSIIINVKERIDIYMLFVDGNACLILYLSNYEIMGIQT